METSLAALRGFFRMAYKNEPGYVCLATMTTDMKDFKETFFEWPRQIEDMIQWVDGKNFDSNVYFCPQLLDKRRRDKEHVKTCTNVWADLDTCHPDQLMVRPTVSVESSPGRFQALWCLAEPLDPVSAENIAMRIAYYHAGHGADRSGWDLTQLLRVPRTFNFKYGNGTYDAPEVIIRETNRSQFRKDDFAPYPDVQGTKELTLPFPEELPTEDPTDILQRHRYKIQPQAFGLYSQEPATSSWSEPLWKLLMYCFEAGMNREEVFVVANGAKCNKYARDNKPPIYLWRDVCRAYLRQQENTNTVITSSELDTLVTDEEARDLAHRDTFVEEYIKWASGTGDAPAQYHQAGAFIILSSILSGAVRIPTSFGNILPNLWFMILADTTLTRKSTAMDLAMDLVYEVDEDILLATDGSIEGMMRAMSMRPGLPSVFLRDEFTGLVESMTKKDYMAGTAELLTKLYDGKPQKRVLSKEVIEVKKPILVIFAGGIKERMQSLLTFEQVSSGFMPRFIFVTAETDLSKVKPLGPPSIRDMGEREFIRGRINAIHKHYNRQTQLELNGEMLQAVAQMQWDVELTPDAWKRYGAFERDMMVAGTASSRPDLMVPTFTRLTISGLKAAALLAASRRLAEDGKVIVEEEDIVRAVKYVEGWRQYGNNVLNGIGRSVQEKELDKILQAITRNPGVSRSTLMQNYHLTSRSADATFSTLEQRGLITAVQVGRGRTYHPIL